MKMQRSERWGRYYYNARWYDPELGRFMTEDPIRDGQNWFVYASNNPLKFVDPTGLKRNQPNIPLDAKQGLENNNTTQFIEYDNPDINARNYPSTSLGEMLSSEEISTKQQNFIDSMILQTDEDLSDIENMHDYGCYFMTTLAVPQIDTFKKLSAEQIKEIYEWSKTEGYLTDDDQNRMWVNNPDAIMSKAYEMLVPSQDYSATTGWSYPGQSDRLAFKHKRIEVNNSDETHSVLFNKDEDNSKLLFDPYPGLNLDNENMDNLDVFIYR